MCFFLSGWDSVPLPTPPWPTAVRSFLPESIRRKWDRLGFFVFPVGGDEQNRTVDPLLARQVLSQLSYTPRYSPRSASHPRPFLFSEELVGSSGLEPPTSRLSGARSNRLSYEPLMVEMSGIEPLTPCLQGRCSPS